MIGLEYKHNFRKLATFEKKGVYKPKRVFWFVLIVVLILLVVASFLNIEQYWESLGSQNDQLLPLLSGLFDWTRIDFLTPDVVGVTFLDQIGTVLKETILNAFVGTLLGAVIAFPLALLAATNVIKFRPLNFLVKLILAIFRTLPIFLIALVMLWFYPPAGNRQFILLIASSFFTVATMSKLLYDKIEQTNMATFNLLEGIGVKKTQAFRQTIMPQMTRFTITSFFYSLEINVRYLSILGLGLGVGFGDLINQNLVTMDSYNKAGFLVFVLIMLVFVLEFIAWLTKRFIFTDQDKVINVKEHYALSWSAKLLKLIPSPVYRLFFDQGSLGRMRLERKFLVRKARLNFVLKKVRTLNKKGSVGQLKADYQQYKKYLNQRFKLEKKLFKTHQKFEKQFLVDKRFYWQRKEFKRAEKIDNFDQLHLHFWKQYVLDHQYVVDNLEVVDFQLVSGRALKTADVKFISTMRNDFYDEQSKYLTTTYVLEQEPHRWVKKAIFFLVLLILFFLIVSQIQVHPESQETINEGLINLPQIFIPSWSSFFGHVGSFGQELEFSAFELVTESVLIATMGTFFGFILALILGALSSSTVMGKYMSKPFWLLATLIRPTPSYIYASFLIVVVPLGPFAGVLALTIVTTAMLCKYIRETFDGVNLQVTNNLRAIGLSRIQVFLHGILPQVSSEITSWALYRFDINIREVATLGAVAAGNMGLWLGDYLQSNQFNEFATLMYALIITSILIEFIVSASRAKILNDKNLKVYDWMVKKFHQHSRAKYLVAYKAKGYRDGYEQSWYILKSDYLRTIQDLSSLKKSVFLTEREKELTKYKRKHILNSLKFLKAYAIYYGLMKMNDELTLALLQEVIATHEYQLLVFQKTKLQLLI